MGKKKGSNIGIQMEQIKIRGNWRIALLDEFRGLAIISVVVYHFCYDMVSIFGMDWQWLYQDKAKVWQIATAGAFIVIAGICTNYSERPFLRAFKVGGCALIITAATYFIYQEQLITFGILHFLAVSMFIYAIFRRILVRINPWVGFLSSLLFIALTWNITKGIIGIGAMTVNLPGFLYEYYWLSPLGFLSPDYYSADYFPLFPNVFIFMAGSYLGIVIKQFSSGFSKEHILPLAILGRFSLLIYMTHQIIIFGVLSLIFRFL